MSGTSRSIIQKHNNKKNLKHRKELIMGGNDRLLRAARGEVLDRPPVWMMRQAGRYMKTYRDLREKYPTFRERSEIPELAAEISLQPFRAFQPDGVIMFSDILTPSQVSALTLTSSKAEHQSSSPQSVLKLRLMH